MQPLKVHWSHSKPNFGDWLSPIVCAHLSGRRVEHADFAHCDLVAIGSLLQRAAEGFWNKRVHVWGTGFIAEQKPVNSRHHYHALRGPLSAALVRNHRVDVFGDPGLLVDRIFPRPQGSRAVLGIVPHYRDRDDPFVQALHRSIRGSRLVDVFEPPAEVVNAIAGCEMVLSSSLHGLVVADSFGIPNAWLKVSARQRGEGFKYRDYYAAFGLEAQTPFEPGERLPSLDTLALHIGDYRRPGLERLKDALVSSFPFPRG